ncbi:hypothetical protein C8Q76DRAFT_689523 [Earliella scabrosa]|nr:hypothetical protein C8Q76DRAFT_689523 [Earliella scabrosa]
MARGNTKHVMPAEGKSLRNLLYGPGMPFPPSDEDKVTVYNAIKAELKGAVEWYSVKKHRTWCSSRESEQRKLVRAYRRSVFEFVQAGLAVHPDPPYSMLVLWAQATRVSVLVVAQIVATCMGDAD